MDSRQEPTAVNVVTEEPPPTFSEVGVFSEVSVTIDGNTAERDTWGGLSLFSTPGCSPGFADRSALSTLLAALDAACGLADNPQSTIERA